MLVTCRDLPWLFLFDCSLLRFRLSHCAAALVYLPRQGLNIVAKIFCLFSYKFLFDLETLKYTLPQALQPLFLRELPGLLR